MHYYNGAIWIRGMHGHLVCGFYLGADPTAVSSYLYQCLTVVDITAVAIALYQQNQVATQDRVLCP